MSYGLNWTTTRAEATDERRGIVVRVELTAPGAPWTWEVVRIEKGRRFETSSRLHRSDATDEHAAKAAAKRNCPLLS